MSQDDTTSAREGIEPAVYAIEELVLLRNTVESWARNAQAAVLDFKKPDGSFRKDSKRVKADKDAPHITTSARAYIALLYADRLRTPKERDKKPEWLDLFFRFVDREVIGRQGKDFYEAQRKREKEKAVDPYEVNTFDVAHFADFFQVFAYLKRFYLREDDERAQRGLNRFFEKRTETSAHPIVFKDRGKQSKKETQQAVMFDTLGASAAIEKRLRDAIQEAATRPQFGGEVCFEERQTESRHYFATLHALRALHALGVTKGINGLSEIVAGARSFAIEQSYYFQRGVTHRQDPVRLAFAGCIYAIYEDHIDKDLCLAIVQALAAAQQPNGSWPATHPIFRKDNVPWHIASHEVALCLSWLYFQPRVPDAARPLLISMMRKYLLSAVIPTYLRAPGPVGNSGPFHGWQDDHTVSPDTTLGWATAIVCHFLAGFVQVLNDWINRRVIEELGLELATKDYLIDDTASSPAPRWKISEDDPYVWPDLPQRAWQASRPDPDEQAEKIADKWTDPEMNATISKSLARHVLAPIYEHPTEQPQRDRCAGLLPGEPGTRKTSLVGVVAELLQWPMVAVPASSIFKDGFDMMEARASRVFDLLNHLRGCVIFFDEFEEFFLSRGEDAKGTARLRKRYSSLWPPFLGGKADSGASEDYKSRTIAAFTTSAMLPRLQELHDKDRCLIFLATNYDYKLDSAIKRQGRFDFTLKVNHPTVERLTQFFEQKAERARKLAQDPEISKEKRDAAPEVMRVATRVAEILGEFSPTQTVKFATVESLERAIASDRAEDYRQLLAGMIKESEVGNPPDLLTLE